LLIFDEIQCGIGRTGRYFYYEKSGILPDILTLAKPLGLGIPLGALLTTDVVAPTFGPGDHGTTFGGGPLACRLGFEFVKILQEEEMLGAIREKGDYFKSKLLGLKDKYAFVVEVRGEGLMLGMQLDFPARDIVNLCLEAGFIITVTSYNVLRFLPPYIITKKEISKFIKTLAKILSQVARERAEGSPAAAQAGGH